MLLRGCCPHGSPTITFWIHSNPPAPQPRRAAADDVTDDQVEEAWAAGVTRVEHVLAEGRTTVDKVQELVRANTGLVTGAPGVN